MITSIVKLERKGNPFTLSSSKLAATSMENRMEDKIELMGLRRWLGVGRVCYAVTTPEFRSPAPT